MKKIILKEKVSEIHIDEVSSKNVIIVKKNGNEFGIMFKHEGYWFCKTSSNTYCKLDISDVIKWCGVNCEFYVLD